MASTHGTRGGSKLKSLVGNKYGRLTVQEFFGYAGNYRGPTWRCLCECGATCIVSRSNLKRGHTKSCGCLSRELAAARKTTHGGRHLVEYTIWRAMNRRCHSVNATSFKYYGGRGITVCEEWRNSFEAFYRDMGPRPSDKHSIDRINNDGNYEPGNCRWAVWEEQGANKRRNVFITIGGERKHAAAWARQYGISAKLLCRRLKRGIEPEIALTTPSRIHK